MDDGDHSIAEAMLDRYDESGSIVDEVPTKVLPPVVRPTRFNALAGTQSEGRFD